ncbi:sigma-54-dependent transcriptional regulator [Pseudoruegeria sp. SHC-113]|uniref:sigma-54-dependent transcriptional regulator n=1 Tax=Pseudoruegeria sp. SHC-113 TaxID=2855439 RepID=UPI0021BADA96|nr:sigma-54 dependent transcriptional regulator [Pseudoruegeria sp. SHC-113]MCT8159240.1 sigma-54 dependent transcriptional regulator [Pseudoruegeria sp. SHC-113]
MSQIQTPLSRPQKSDGQEFALSGASILVIDDEPGMRNFLVKILKPRCLRVEQAANTDQAAKLMDQVHFDIVILDNVMPGKTGLDWLREQREVGFYADAILITAFADLETAIQALRAGAVDFVLKPFRSNQILNAVARCLDRMQLRRENYLLKHELASDAAGERGRLLGSSDSIREIRNTLERAAPLPTSVLFTGASGTGKEIAARTLHAISDRAAKPFVPVNCAAISPDRIETELFGHVPDGSAPRPERKDGLFAYANGGTLFLDEIAELPLPVQATLLRVIEEKRIRPAGATREIPLDVRFVFATNADLPAAVEAGRFRADLYHRINVLTITMPRLKDRIGDVQELALMFMQKISRDLGVLPLTLTEDVLVNLSRYDWPGNVRELRNLIERSLILGEFPPEFAGQQESDTDAPSESLHVVERRHILAVLEACGGNRAEAARRLGVSRKTVDRKCAMWNV